VIDREAAAYWIPRVSLSPGLAESETRWSGMTVSVAGHLQPMISFAPGRVSLRRGSFYKRPFFGRLRTGS